MKYIYTNKEVESQFELTNEFYEIRSEKPLNDSFYKILWNVGNEACNLMVDNQPLGLQKNEMIFLTPFQNLELKSHHDDLRFFKFNRELYCIQDHDEEISCIGLLFYGVNEYIKIEVEEDQREAFENLYNVFLNELENDDDIQGEMITSLLKSLIIKSTRLAKMQIQNLSQEDTKIDIVREFNLLVEKNFRSLKKVSEYAELLYKSPKTLSNLFLQYQLESPSKVISNRILLESKRLFLYTNKSDKEIAYELGYDNPSHFSRFIKTNTGMSPTVYKKTLKR
jgi:AraC-like DNA-binding protein